MNFYKFLDKSIKIPTYLNGDYIGIIPLTTNNFIYALNLISMKLSMNNFMIVYTNKNFGPIWFSQYPENKRSVRGDTYDIQDIYYAFLMLDKSTYTNAIASYISVEYHKGFILNAVFSSNNDIPVYGYMKNNDLYIIINNKRLGLFLHKKCIDNNFIDLATIISQLNIMLTVNEVPSIDQIKLYLSEKEPRINYNDFNSELLKFYYTLNIIDINIICNDYIKNELIKIHHLYLTSPPNFIFL
jgi:hypothetical protein